MGILVKSIIKTKYIIVFCVLIFQEINSSLMINAVLFIFYIMCQRVADQIY